MTQVASPFAAPLMNQIASPPVCWTEKNGSDGSYKSDGRQLASIKRSNQPKPTHSNQFFNLDFRLFEFWTVILFKSLVNCDCCSLLTRNGHGTVINRIIYLLLSGFIVSVSTYLTTERCILNGDDDGRHCLLLPESSLVSTVIKSGVLVFIKDLTTLLSLFYLAHE